MLTDDNFSTLEGLIICGRMFSFYPALEYKANIDDKIGKFNKALNSWKKRPLSIYGRCLILKTFGLVN
jgi:hypothetical protein